MRIFDDGNGQMNLSVNDINGEILVVSRSLFMPVQKGNRPSFIRASKPNHAIPMYEKFIMNLTEKVLNEVHTGEFGASMQIKLVNDGPVTIWIDSRNRE